MKKIILLLVSIFILMLSSIVQISKSYDAKETIFLDSSSNIAYALAIGFGMVSFDLEDPSTFTLICSGSSDFLTGGTWANNNWYVVDYYSPALYIVNITNGELHLIGGSGTAYNDIAFDMTTGTMYGASSYNFYKINLKTGAQTLVGCWGSSYLMIDIVIDNEGVIYGHDIVSDSIYIIDKNTAEVTLLYSNICATDMEFDHDNNICYAYGEGALYKFNLSYFDCDFVGWFQDNSEIAGLAIPYTIPETEPPIAKFSYTPWCPSVDEKILFDASESYDPDGCIVYYEWDWDNDGNYEQSTTNPLIRHNWSYAGNYSVTLHVIDNFMADSTKTHIITIYENNPPLKPIINGPQKGKIKTEYIYYISPIVDPDQDNLYVFWDWGDGTNTSWLGAYPSGMEIYKSHSWKAKSIYIIKAKIKDEHGAESEWGTLTVTIPRYRVLYDFNWSNLLERFLKLFEVFTK